MIEIEGEVEQTDNEEGVQELIENLVEQSPQIFMNAIEGSKGFQTMK